MTFSVKAWNILQGLEIILSELSCRVKLLLWLNSHCYSRIIIKKKEKEKKDSLICFFKNTENYLKYLFSSKQNLKGFYCLYICLFIWFFFP